MQLLYPSLQFDKATFSRMDVIQNTEYGVKFSYPHKAVTMTIIDASLNPIHSQKNEFL